MKNKKNNLTLCKKKKSVNLKDMFIVHDLNSVPIFSSVDPGSGSRFTSKLNGS